MSQATLISRDETQAKLNLRGAAGMKVRASQTYTIAERVEESAASFGNNFCLAFQDQRYTYAQLNEQVNRVAHILHNDLGVRCGDVVGLALENRAEFFFYWFGLMKVGAVASFINTNITGKPLAHAFEVTHAKACIVGEEVLAQFDAPEVAHIAKWLVRDAEKPATPEQIASCAFDFSSKLASSSTANPPAAWRAGLVAEMPAIYVFTSGTTGLPKAAIISHARWLMTCYVMQQTLHTTAEDIFYAYLPLYHGAASLSLTPTAFVMGSGLVTRRKFSKSEFWNDVRKYGITAMQYVGEICRYLLTNPPQANDKEHKLRVMTGTGLATELWNAWVDRFGDMQIIESWGSTEANTSTVNVDNRVGSVGRIPDWSKTNLKLLAYDVDNDCHITDENGKKRLAQPGEVGEAIGMIFQIPDSIAGRFEGYTDPAANEKKIYRNVLQEGDAWWASGDLLREDEDGYLWFVDRLGDTFRWKSENVSTMEVADSLGDFPGIETITIYGVKVGSHSGRAGMAAITLQEGASFDGKAFYELCSQRIPRYAAPLFVRIMKVADMTSTYKLRKVDLQKEGFDPAVVKDALWVRDEKQGAYVPYNEDSVARAVA